MNGLRCARLSLRSYTSCPCNLAESDVHDRRYHYLHSGKHGEHGMNMLNDGTHPAFLDRADPSETSPSPSPQPSRATSKPAKKRRNVSDYLQVRHYVYGTRTISDGRCTRFITTDYISSYRDQANSPTAGSGVGHSDRYCLFNRRRVVRLRGRSEVSLCSPSSTYTAGKFAHILDRTLLSRPSSNLSVRFAVAINSVERPPRCRQYVLVYSF